jgi:hypothetical protein
MRGKKKTPSDSSNDTTCCCRQNLTIQRRTTKDLLRYSLLNAMTLQQHNANAQEKRRFSVRIYLQG